MGKSNSSQSRNRFGIEAALDKAESSGPTKTQKQAVAKPAPLPATDFSAFDFFSNIPKPPEAPAPATRYRDETNQEDKAHLKNRAAKIGQKKHVFAGETGGFKPSIAALTMGMASTLG